MTKVHTPTIDLKAEVDPALVGAKAEAGILEFAPKGEAVVAPDAVTGDDGRTYHGLSKGAYLYPNDPAEQDRLDFQHEMCNLILDGRFGLAPIQSPEYVLDVATGTGLWAIDFAKEHPTSKVFGSDLSEIQRPSSVPNIYFLQQDVERQDWNFSHKFDYIHLRYVVGCFNDTKVVMQKAIDNLNPDGWIEFFDVESFAQCIDDTMEGTAIAKWSELVFKGGSTVGRSPRKPSHYKQWMEEIGFVDVVEKVFQSPLNTWPKDPRMKQIGAYQRDCLLGILRGISKFINLTGLDQDSVDKLVLEVENEIRDTNIHIYWPIHVVYGRKPSS